jgi:thioredoxin-related protein
MRKIINFLTRFIFLSFIPSFAIGADFELDKIVSDANRTDKHVLLFFHKDGCGFCERMIFNLEDTNISQSIKKDFIFVDINRDDDETISFQGYSGTTKDFLKKLGVDLYPTVAFLDGNSTFIYNVIGYRDKKSFLRILDYIQNKIYKKVTFEEFEDELLTDKE